MKICNILIEGFRSVKQLQFAPSQICALVGPNNAGKSNILTAIYRVFGREWVNASSFDESDIYGRIPENDIRITLSIDPPIPYTKFKYSDPVSISTFSFEYTHYKRGEQKGQPRLEQQCFGPDGGKVFVLRKAPQRPGTQSSNSSDYEPLTTIPQDVREAVPVIYIGTNRSLKEHLPSARYSLLRPLFEGIDRDLHDPANIIRVVKDDGGEEDVQRAEQFQRLLKAAMRLLRTQEFEQIEAAIKRNALKQLGFDPDADTERMDLFFSPFDTMDFYKSLDLRVREGDFSVSATELGEGFQNALVLSILQVFEERRKKGAVLLIEEPEMFLHPQMQRSLYKTLRGIGETNQVIYATHSPHFVTIPDFHEIFMVRKGLDGTTVRRSDLPNDRKRREKLIKELDPERSELFFATRLLLVEGDTEKLALPEYARRLGFDLDREGATIIEVGGKRNLYEFASIANSFGIPTGIMYDNDTGESFNGQLDALILEGIQVWRLSKNYEDCLRNALGEEKYRELCEKFSEVGKPTQARLIAADDGLPVPAILEEAIRWLANR